MAVSSQLSRDGGTLTITVEGPFDFSLHKDFRDAYRQYSPELHFIVDLSHCSRIDSSALGMLLLLREHFGSSRSQITIRGCRQEVREILNLSQLERLFEIE